MARPKLDRPALKLALWGRHYALEYWWEGRSHRVSTGTADEQAAREFPKAFEAGWAEPEPPPEPTIGRILDGYSHDRKNNTEHPLSSPTALDAGCAALWRHLGDLRPEFLTRERCRLYARQRRAEGYEVGAPGKRRRKPVKDGTVLRELGILRVALTWAKDENWITSVPHVEGPSTPEPRDRWLTREEAAALMAACGDFHIRVFTALALHTAARTGAILELTWDRVDLSARRIDYGHGNEHKRRVLAVPLGDNLAALLAQARELARSNHVIEFAGKPVGSVRTGFLAACRRAELNGVTPHVLRHTAATWMAQKGVPMWQIAGLLGNTVEVVARIYAEHSPEHLRRATEAIGNVGVAAAAPVVRVRKARNAAS